MDSRMWFLFWTFGFLLQEKDNGRPVVCGEWKISEENTSGWRSIRCVTTGKYLTTTSSQLLSSQGINSNS